MKSFTALLCLTALVLSACASQASDESATSDQPAVSSTTAIGPGEVGEDPASEAIAATETVSDLRLAGDQDLASEFWITTWPISALDAERYESLGEMSAKSSLVVVVELEKVGNRQVVGENEEGTPEDIVNYNVINAKVTEVLNGDGKTVGDEVEITTFTIGEAGAPSGSQAVLFLRSIDEEARSYGQTPSPEQLGTYRLVSRQGVFLQSAEGRFFNPITAAEGDEAAPISREVKDMTGTEFVDATRSGEVKKADVDG